jgi:hypothetical protein
MLESVKLRDGVYVDEEFFLTMDYELWMRMAAKAPFVNRIDKVLAYYRIYDVNKTGSRPLATQRECSRVFRRHATLGTFHEQNLSFIIPFAGRSDGLDATVRSILEQACFNFDLLFVDYSEERMQQKVNHDYVLDLGEQHNHVTMRYEKAWASSLVGALNRGVQVATAPLVAFMQPGDRIPGGFSLVAMNLFSRDFLGLVVPDIGRADISHAFSLRDGVVDIRSILAAPHMFPNFVVRRLACMELGPFRMDKEPTIAIKEFLLRLFFRGWSLLQGHGLTLAPVHSSYPQEDTLLYERGAEVVQSLLNNLKQELDADPFSPVRSVVRPYQQFCRTAG